MPSPARIYHPDGLAAAKACATSGLCLFCESELPERAWRARSRIICGSTPCMTSYISAWKRDRRSGAPRANAPVGARVRWHCDCGRSYCDNFFRSRHRRRCLFAAQAWPVVVVPARAAA